MLRMDKKVARQIRKMQTVYTDDIWYNPDRNLFQKVIDKTQAPVVVETGLSQMEVIPSLIRLDELDYIKLQINALNDCYFSIRPKLKHRFAFALDTFSKRYVGGFISGVLTTVAATLIVEYIQGVI